MDVVEVTDAELEEEEEVIELRAEEVTEVAEVAEEEVEDVMDDASSAAALLAFAAPPMPPGFARKPKPPPKNSNFGLMPASLRLGDGQESSTPRMGDAEKVALAGLITYIESLGGSGALVADWAVTIVPRDNAGAKGQDCYYFAASGRRFRSRKEVGRHFELFGGDGQKEAKRQAVPDGEETSADCGYPALEPDAFPPAVPPPVAVAGVRPATHEAGRAGPTGAEEAAHGSKRESLFAERDDAACHSASTADSRKASPDEAIPLIPVGMGPVSEMLTELRLEKYCDAFEDLGYDDLFYLMGLEPSRLSAVAKEAMMKPGHAMKFVELLPTYRPRV